MASALSLTEMLATILETTEFEFYEETEMTTSAMSTPVAQHLLTVEEVKKTFTDIAEKKEICDEFTSDSFLIEFHDHVNSSFMKLLNSKCPEKSFSVFLRQMPLPSLSECPSDVVNVARHVVCRLWHEINSRQTERTENSCENIPELSDAGNAKIIDHGGWCVLRTKQTLTSSTSLSLRTSEDESSAIEKDEAIKLCNFLGKDVAGDDGTFKFILKDICMDFFVYLHQCSESFVCNANRSDLSITSSDMCLQMLQFLASNKELREKWNMLSSGFEKKSSILVLKYICEFFVKVKQKQLIIKFGLQPQKSSVSLRQGLRKISSGKPKKVIDHNIERIQSNFENAAVVESALQCVRSLDNRMDILSLLTCQQLSVLLASFGLPSLKGKKKEKMVMSMINHMDTSSSLIVYPEKLKSNLNTFKLIALTNKKCMSHYINGHSYT